MLNFIKKNNFIKIFCIIALVVYIEPQSFKQIDFPILIKIDYIYKILKLIVMFITSFIYVKNVKKISKILFWLLILQGMLFISTVINDGDLFRFIGPSLTTLTMAMLAEILIKKKMLFSVLKSVNKYLLFCYILNFISMVIIDFNGLNDTIRFYFLGIDNRFIFTFLPWIFFEGLISLKEENKLNKRFFFVFFACEAILFYKFSAAACLILLLYFSLFLKKLDLSKYYKTTFLSYIFVNISFIFLKVQNMFASFIKFINKDITLSGRTFLWDGVTKIIKEKPLLGIGMQSDSFDKNFFYNSSSPYFFNHCKVVHAHNSLMSIVYRGGLISLLIYLYIIFLVFKNLKLNKTRYSMLNYVTLIIILGLSIFDTIDFASLYFIFVIIYNSNALNKEDINYFSNDKNNKFYMFFKKAFLKIYRTANIWFFNMFPINNKKIIFSNFVGRGYGDSGKYIVEEIVKEKKKYEMYWLVNSKKEADSLPDYVKPLKNDSIKYFYHLCTARVWVDNRRPVIRLYKRKNQFYIQTWHGGIALKKIEGDAEHLLNKRYIKGAKIDSKAIDLMTSNCDFCTKMYRNAFWYDGEIHEYGLPRNDILFKESIHQKIKEKVYKRYNIDENFKIVLYAPTFRESDDLSVYDIDYPKLLKNIKNKFGSDFKVLVRLHPNIIQKSKEMKIFSDDIMNASSYEDMYELMIAADVLITDYSSCMFEFSFLKKPVFLYAKDIKNYDDERGFYFNYFSLPYPIAESMNSFLDNITNFDNKNYQKNLRKFFDKINLKETGKSSKMVVKKIVDVIEGE